MRCYYRCPMNDIQREHPYSLTYFQTNFCTSLKKKFAFRFNFENPQKKNLDKDLALDLMNLLLKDRNIPEDHMKYFAGKLLDLKRKVIFLSVKNTYLLQNLLFHSKKNFYVKQKVRLSSIYLSIYLI